MLRLLLGVAALAAAAPAHAQALVCTGADLCPGLTSPCTVSAPVEVAAAGCVFDLTGIDVTFQDDVDAAGFAWTLLANDATLDLAGRFLDSTDTGPAITLTLTADYVQLGTVDLANDFSAGVFDVTADGSIWIAGDIDLQGAGDPYASGGYTTLDGALGVTVDAQIDVGAPGKGFGGGIDIVSGAAVSTTANLDALAGWWGGDVSIDAEDDVVLDGQVNVEGTTNGDGGFVWIASANGGVTVNAIVDAHGSGSAYYGGYWGGDVTITAATAIEVYADLNAKGSIPDGDGGTIFLDADSITTTGLLNANGVGTDSAGGSIDLWGGAAVTTLGNVEASGGSFDGGYITITADGDVSIGGKVRANADNGGWGGWVTLTSTGGAVILTDDVEAKSTGGGGDSGSIAIEACDISVAVGATVDTRIGFGTNDFVVHETMTLDGEARAATSNTFTYRSAAPTLNGLVDVPETLVLDPALTSCLADADTDADTDSHTDADTDADSDTDADTDSDTDADTDAGFDTGGAGGTTTGTTTGLSDTGPASTADSDPAPTQDTLTEPGGDDAPPPGDSGKPAPGGCGCASGPAGGGVAGLLVALAVGRRRRRLG